MEDFWIVGGWVRDKLWGKEPKDIDLASPWLPSEVMEWATSQGYEPRVVNEKHLVVAFTMGGVRYEHTTFRVESDCDGIEASCQPSRSLTEDLCRRDFTINALAYPFSLVDRDFDRSKIEGVPGWEKDIKEKVLRICSSDLYGSEMDRLEQSGNRFFRAARFVAKYDMFVDEKTREALRAFSPRAFEVSNPESFREEWEKSNYSRVFLKFLRSLGFLGEEPHFSQRDLFSEFPWWEVFLSSCHKDFFEEFKVPRKVKAEIGEIQKALSLGDNVVSWHIWSPRHIQKEELIELLGLSITLKKDLRSLSSFFEEFGKEKSVKEVKVSWVQYVSNAYNIGVN